MNEFKPTYVNLEEVPMRHTRAIWKQRFDNIPPGKAVMLQYNNRQRAYQVRQTIQKIAKYLGVSLATRTMPATKAIHGIEGWLVYFWKPKAEGK